MLVRIVERKFEHVAGDSYICQRHMISEQILAIVGLQCLLQVVQVLRERVNEELSDVIVFLLITWQEIKHEAAVLGHELFPRLHDAVYLVAQLRVGTAWIQLLSLTSSNG